MDGCYKAFSKHECDHAEEGRLEMSRTQTALNHNYTELGFKKRRVPEALFQEIKEFYNKYKIAGKKQEKWTRANTVVNNWEVPTHMISFEDKENEGGWDLKQRIWDGLNPVLLHHLYFS